MSDEPKSLKGAFSSQPQFFGLVSTFFEYAKLNGSLVQLQIAKIRGDLKVFVFPDWAEEDLGKALDEVEGLEDKGKIKDWAERWSKRFDL